MRYSTATTKQIALARIAFAVLFVAAWYLVAWSNLVFLFKSPDVIVQRLFQMVSSGELFQYLMLTLVVLAKAIALSAGVGLVLGILIGRISWFRVLTEATVNTLYVAPVAALIPFIIVTLGFGERSKILVIFLSSLFPILINTAAGVRSVDADLKEVARSFCAKEWTVWRDILVPGALPMIITGLRLGLISGLVGSVVADFYVGSSGLGYLIILYSNQFDTAGALVPVLLLGAGGIGISALLNLALRRLSPWAARS